MIKDYQILKESINKVLKETPLDVGAKYYILKDVFTEIEQTYYATINSELMAESEEITIGEE